MIMANENFMMLNGISQIWKNHENYLKGEG
jgi:hypothetical protein